MAGRPRMQRKSIVDDLYDEDYMRIENNTLIGIAVQLSNNLSMIEWFAKRRLLVNSLKCEVCKDPCTLNRSAESPDGWKWRCIKDNFSRSLRTKSFFEQSRLSLRQIICIIYMWSYDYPQHVISREAEVSKRTTSEWCNMIRDLCEQFLETNPQQLGGISDDGKPIEVEIDESKFFHRKYHRGEWQPGHWVFGAIERGSGRCFLIEVADWKKETILPIIQQWILPGTRILSSGWQAYAEISNIGDGIYSHDIVVTESRISTQLIENTWIRAKKKLRREFGTSESMFPSYLAEFMWRRRMGENKFGEMLCCIANVYC